MSRWRKTYLTTARNIALIALCMHVDHQQLAELSRRHQNSIALTVNSHISHQTKYRCSTWITKVYFRHKSATLSDQRIASASAAVRWFYDIQLLALIIIPMGVVWGFREVIKELTLEISLSFFAATTTCLHPVYWKFASPERSENNHNASQAWESKIIFTKSQRNTMYWTVRPTAKKFQQKVIWK